MSGEILLIDNLDSFTFNLVDAINRLGRKVRVVRNSVEPEWALDFAERNGSSIVISPGPGSPDAAGRCLDIVNAAKGRVPLLGVCLGHQAIVQTAGGKVTRSVVPVHGKASVLKHDGAGPFEGIASPIRVGRYHSLCTRNLPERFHIHAKIDGMAMAISDPAAFQIGLQFHPESILTRDGDAILRNILRF